MLWCMWFYLLAAGQHHFPAAQLPEGIIIWTTKINYQLPYYTLLQLKKIIHEVVLLQHNFQKVCYVQKGGGGGGP